MNKTMHLTPDANDNAPNFQQRIINEISPQISKLDYGEIREAKDLFNKEFWDPLESSVKQEFGRRISLIVSLGKVDLEHAGINKARHNIYRKI